MLSVTKSALWSRYEADSVALNITENDAARIMRTAFLWTTLTRAG